MLGYSVIHFVLHIIILSFVGKTISSDLSDVCTTSFRALAVSPSIVLATVWAEVVNHHDDSRRTYNWSK